MAELSHVRGLCVCRIFWGARLPEELREGYAILEDVGCNHIIDERRAQLEENVEKRRPAGLLSLLDSQITLTKIDPLPRDDVFFDVNDIMAAGHRTTASF